MNDAVNFLRNKGILGVDKTQWIISFEDGRSFDLVDLFTEFKDLESDDTPDFYDRIADEIKNDED